MIAFLMATLALAIFFILTVVMMLDLFGQAKRHDDKEDMTLHSKAVKGLSDAVLECLIADLRHNNTSWGKARRLAAQNESDARCQNKNQSRR
jgi:hypothetical protein